MSERRQQKASVRAASAAMAVLATIAAIGVPQARADPPQDLSPSDYPALAIAAEQFGLSFNEAFERYGWHNDFAVLVTRMEKAYPAFASAEINSHFPAVATIRFRGDAPDGARSMTDELSQNVTVRFESGADKSSEEIAEFVIHMHEAVSEAGAGVIADMMSEYNPQTSTVDIVARPLEPTDSEQRQSLAASIVAEMPSEVQEQVELTLDPRFSTRTEARFGGGRMVWSGNLNCTSGFNVTDGERTGVTTAGHCPRDLSHRNCGTCVVWRTTTRGRHRGAWGDFQWGTTSNNEPDNFYYQWDARLDVTDTAFAVRNQLLCRFGRASGTACNFVARRDICATLDGRQTCRLVRMHEDTGEFHDSGGPWFDGYAGTVAYGFHTGQVGCGLSTCDVWSSTENIFEALGVWVRR